MVISYNLPAMHGYKVIFNNNHPILAIKLNHIDNSRVVHISKKNNHRIMDWLVVCGNNEHDALSVAGKIFRNFWAAYIR